MWPKDQVEWRQPRQETMVTREDLSNDQKILLDAWVSYWDFQNNKKEEARKRAEEKRKKREEEARIDQEIKE